GALDRDAPGEGALFEAGVDEALLREPDAVCEDDDLVEAELRRVREGREEALVEGGLAAEKHEPGRAAGFRLVEGVEDGLQIDRPRHAELCELAADAEDATVVAEVTELNLELVSGHLTGH